MFIYHVKQSPDKEVDIGTILPELKVLVTRRDKEYREGYDPKKDTDRDDVPEFIPPTNVVKVVPLPEITAGKPGGLGEGENLYEQVGLCVAENLGHKLYYDEIWTDISVNIISIALNVILQTFGIGIS